MEVAELIFNNLGISKIFPHGLSLPVPLPEVKVLSHVAIKMCFGKTPRLASLPFHRFTRTVNLTDVVWPAAAPQAAAAACDDILLNVKMGRNGKRV